VGRKQVEGRTRSGPREGRRWSGLGDERPEVALRSVGRARSHAIVNPLLAPGSAGVGVTEGCRTVTEGCRTVTEGGRTVTVRRVFRARKVDSNFQNFNCVLFGKLYKVLHFDTWSFAPFGSHDIRATDDPGVADRRAEVGRTGDWSARDAVPRVCFSLRAAAARATCGPWAPGDLGVDGARPFVIFFSQIGGSPSNVNEIGVFANFVADGPPGSVPHWRSVGPAALPPQD
jgi:hypothetical protein